MLQEEKDDHKKRCSCKTSMSCVTGRKGQWQRNMELKIKRDMQLQNWLSSEQHWLCESYAHIKSLNLQNQSCYTIERECICCSRGTGYWVARREPTGLTKKKPKHVYQTEEFEDTHWFINRIKERSCKHHCSKRNRGSWGVKKLQRSPVEKEPRKLRSSYLVQMFCNVFHVSFLSWFWLLRCKCRMNAQTIIAFGII